MRKFITLLLIIAAFVAWGNVLQAQTSLYCSTPSGHLNDANFGDAKSHILLTITKVDANNISVKVEPNTTGAAIDFLLVEPAGGAAVQVGTDEGAILPEYKALVNFPTPPENVTLTIMWSNPSWGGRWMIQNLVVPFNATCAPVVPDAEAPKAFTATKGAVTSSSVELLLNATDNSGAVTYTITYGTSTLNTSGTSATQKSYIVSSLQAATPYTFSVVAKDAAGNQATNSPISITATTAAVAVPTTAAPTPPVYSAAQVISIFSNAYTNVAGTNYNPNWSQTTQVTPLQVVGDDVLKYSNLNYQGTQFGSDVVAVNMEFLHIDVWTENETSLQIFCISRSTGEKSVQLTPLNLNAWNSFDIPLTSFTSQGLSIADLKEFKIVGSGGKTVYVDNLYFYTNTVVVDAEAPTAFTATKGAVTESSVELLLKATDNSGAVSYTITYGTSTVNVLGVSGTQKSHKVTGLTPSTLYTFNVVVADATGNVATNNPIIVSATTAAVPGSAPTPPVYQASRVISIFSDAYSNVSSINYNASWGQATTFEIFKVGQDNILKYGNLNYQGIDFNQNISAANMKYLHIDVWTLDETTLKFTFISPGPKEKLTALTPLNLNAWNSFDIPLNDFATAGVDLANLFQIKFTGAGGKTIYVDNIYLYTDVQVTDTEAPTAFTAVKGNVTYNSVELLLNATDNFGAVVYTVTQGTNTVTVNGVSGVQKSHIFTGLEHSTLYTFSIVAKDAAGNQATNSPIVVSATTAVGFNAPTTAAPAPTLAATSVISLFSNAYTNISGMNFNPNWQQVTTYSSVQVAGNDVLKYENLNYQGIEFPPTMATSMKYLHLDVWTPNETSLKITLISPGKEKLIALTPLTLDTWNSFDIPVTDFTGVDMANVNQIKIVGSNGKTIYLDNIYLYTDVQGVDTQAPTAFTATKGNVTYSSVELLLNSTDNFGAIVYTVTQGTNSVTINGVSAVQKSHTFTGLEPATLYTFSVVAKDAAGNQATNSPIVLTVTTSAGFNVPTTAAPAPTLPAASVISLFSNAYTNISGINYDPDWGTYQTTVYSAVQVAGNDVLKYEYLNFQGIEFPHTNASNMKYLHLDVWTPNETSLKITLISPWKEKLIPLTLVFDTWNSFDIPLTDFTGVDMADVYQIKIEGAGGKIVYLDNIYLYDDSNLNDTQAPTAFTATLGVSTLTSVELLLKANDNSGTVIYTVTNTGTNATATINGVSGVEKSVSVTNLTMATIYTFSVTATDVSGNAATNTPIVLIATTQSTPSMSVLENNLIINPLLNSRQEFTIVSNTNWTIEGAPAWLTLDKLTGNGTLRIAAIAQANTTDAPRTATLTIKATGVSDITVTLIQAATSTLPFDFETGVYGFANFDGGYASVIDNPQKTSINTSDKVAVMIRNGGQNWAGAYLATKNKLDLTTTSSFQMKVYSPKAAMPILVKLEDGAGAFAEVTVNTTKSNEWETLTWNFIGKPSNVYNRVVFIFDNGVIGNGSANSTFYFDDVQLVVPPVMSVSATTLSVAATANSITTFNITSNTDWTVVSNQTWLTLSSASGSNNATITLTAEANTVTASREAIVTINGTGVAAKTITVTQAAGVTSVSESAENMLQIFPNPTTNSLTISNITSNSSISIIDLNGKVLMHKPLTSTTESIDVSHLANGVYIMKVTDNKSVIVSKFVKQ